jgi:hypothetical protein
MGINTLTPRYLNLDNDSRIIAAQEMIDAQNVRISADDDGNQGVVKNIAGNTNLTGFGLGYSVGVNTIVGAYEHEGTNRFFVFVHNNTGYNTVYELEQGGNTFTKIIESANIRFSGEPLHIDGMMIGDELHLYFTDGVEEPQKINVDTNLIVGSYPSSYIESNVMKKAPDAPQVSFSTDTSRKSNELFGKSFQFAFQYVFRDGEVSAIGEYSENVTSVNTLNSISDTQTYQEQNNKITLQIGTGTLGIGFGSTVPKVRAYFRDVYDNTLYYIGEYTAGEANTGVAFYNDASYSVVPDNEFNKIQDAVPKLAKAQTISANRLFYGNYTEGFDKATVSATITPSYNPLPLVADFDETVTSTASASTIDLNTENVSSFLDGTMSIPTTIRFAFGGGDDTASFGFQDGTARDIDILNPDGTNFTSIAAAQNTVPPNVYIDRTEFDTFVNISATTSYTTYNTNLANHLNGQTVSCPVGTGFGQWIGTGFNYRAYWTSGTAEFSISATSTSTGIQLVLTPTSYVVRSNEIYRQSLSGSGTNPFIPYDGLTATLSETIALNNATQGNFELFSNSSGAVETAQAKTFKAGESHSFGIVFEDDYGRTTGVYELGSEGVLTIGARTDDNKGFVNFDLVPTATNLDSSLTRFFYVYSGGNNIENFTQYGVAEAYVEDVSKHPEDASSDSIYLSIRTLQGKSQSYCSRGNKINYSFAEGDKLRVISYDDSNGVRVYPDNIEFDIDRLITLEEDILAHSGSDNHKTLGEFLVLQNKEIQNFSRGDVDAGSDIWGSNVVVEIYSPSKQNSVKIYKAISGKYSVSSDLGGTHTLTEGNVWYKRRQILFPRSADNFLDTEILYVESQHYYDKDSQSKGDLGGKPYAVINNEKQQNRISSVTYSEPQLADSAQNNLSSFNNSLANFADYEMNYGGIFGLVDMSDSIMVLQSDKVSRIPVSRQILATGSGSEFVTQSTDILGLQQHYGGNFGINEDRTAFLKADGTVYLVDVTRSKIVALTEQGVNLLSDKSVSTFVDERSKSMLADAQGYYVSIGYDKENKEVLFSLQNKPLTNTKSLVYSVGLEKFTTFVDYTGTFYGTLGNRFFQVRDNQVWEAEQNSIYGSFFGLQYDAYIEAVFNQDPTSRKVYNAIGVDATANPSATITTIDQEVSMPEGLFSLKEGVYYGHVPREEGTSQFVVLGEVQSENDPEITMKAKVNRLPFRLGGDVYKLDSGVFTQIAGVTADSLVSPRVLSMSNAGAVTAGDEIAVKGASVDGDPIRGAYAEVKLTFNDATAFELFAVSAHTSESGLHNNSQQ